MHANDPSRSKSDGEKWRRWGDEQMHIHRLGPNSVHGNSICCLDSKHQRTGKRRTLAEKWEFLRDMLSTNDYDLTMRRARGKHSELFGEILDKYYYINLLF